MFGFKLGLRLEVEEDHEAFWSWRDKDGILHQLKPMWAVAIDGHGFVIMHWAPRCSPDLGRKKKMNATPITCVACLGWRGTTEAP